MGHHFFSLDRSRWKQRPMWRTSLPERMVLWRRWGLAQQPAVNFTMNEFFRTLFGLQKGEILYKVKINGKTAGINCSILCFPANGWLSSELTCSKEQPLQCCQIPGLERSIVLRFTPPLLVPFLPFRIVKFCSHMNFLHIIIVFPFLSISRDLPCFSQLCISDLFPWRPRSFPQRSQSRTMPAVALAFWSSMKMLEISRQHP